MSLTKWCPRCKKDVPVEKFSKASRRSDGLQPYCKSCALKNNHDSVMANGGYGGGARKRARDKAQEKVRSIVKDYLLNNSCTDCGESDFTVLEFDHVRGEKLFNIAEAMYGGKSLTALRVEMAKCEVRCANCHRRKTARQLGWWRALTDGIVEE